MVVYVGLCCVVCAGACGSHAACLGCCRGRARKTWRGGAADPRAHDASPPSAGRLPTNPLRSIARATLLKGERVAGLIFPSRITSGACLIMVNLKAADTCCR